ncbi:52 kDa repressor of the inhibitor of the protein kinase-like isoform X2 [Euwallacea similis]|uniref:52 kDa repressor of the inhibitor of the protein kinase-like isoform X2 n=1 Tax=Euwallacea similis TaxID=1736056 RepID=UPI00344BD648
MGGCSALGCRNSSAKGFLMRKFPKDPKRRQQWITNTKRGNWIPSEGACLCEVHFAPEMWEKVRQDGSRKLADHAIPTIFNYTHYTSSKKCRVMGGLTPQKQDSFQKKLKPQSEPSKVWVKLHQVLQKNEQDFIIVKIEKDERIEKVNNKDYNIDSSIILLDSQGGETQDESKHIPVLSLPSSSQIHKTSLESQNKQYFIKSVNPIGKNKQILLINDMEKLKAENEELRSKIQNLQEQLKTSETEHQKTVIFSQILQFLGQTQKNV